jgi:hypothetical protein
MQLEDSLRAWACHASTIHDLTFASATDARVMPPYLPTTTADSVQSL